MNRKQLSLLIVLLVVLGGLSLLIHRNDANKPAADGGSTEQKLLGKDFPVADVAQVTLKQGSNEVNLVKKDDTWRVRERNDYPANFPQINELVEKMADLKVMRSEAVGASQLAELQLAPPGQGTNSALMVDFKDKGGKTIKSVLLGKFHLHKLSAAQKAQFGEGEGEGYPDGRYVMLADDPKTLLLVGDPLNSNEPQPAQWLNKDFFKVEKPKLLAVTFPVETNSWKITRASETNAWEMAEVKPGENVDTNKFLGLATAFASASFDDVTNAKPEEVGLDKPTVVKIETMDGFNYAIKVGKKLGEDYPMTLAVTAGLSHGTRAGEGRKARGQGQGRQGLEGTSEGLDDKLTQTKAFEKWTYLVPAWSLDNFLKERKDLMVEKKRSPRRTRARRRRMTPNRRTRWKCRRLLTSNNNSRWLETR